MMSASETGNAAKLAAIGGPSMKCTPENVNEFAADWRVAEEFVDLTYGSPSLSLMEGEAPGSKSAVSK